MKIDRRRADKHKFIYLWWSDYVQTCMNERLFSSFTITTSTKKVANMIGSDGKAFPHIKDKIYIGRYKVGSIKIVGNKDLDYTTTHIG